MSVTETKKPKTEEAEVKFQHYASPCRTMRIATPTGQLIDFVRFEFVTADQNLIDFLNEEIKNGLKITKGALQTREESDPMVTMKKKHIAEYLAEKAAADADPDKFAGNYDAGKVNPTSTKVVASAKSK